MVCTEDHTLEMTPKTLNAIGGNTILGELLLAVLNDTMFHTFHVKARI
jgi:hypothetical protein